MRTLTQQEIDVALDDNGEAEDGFEPREAAISELTDYSTFCGTDGNRPFEAIAKKYPDRLVRGWMLNGPSVWDGATVNEVRGMVHIQCTEDEGPDIEELASEAGGSLRFDGPTGRSPALIQLGWDKFCVFEVE